MSQPTLDVSNKYDLTQLKNAVDDEISRYFSKEQNFKQSYRHTDIKLALGYASCIVAAGAFYYEYKTSFREALNVTTVAVIVFWVLQALLFTYSLFVEKNEIFRGTQIVDGKAIGTLSVTGKIKKHSPMYQLTFTYQDKATSKSVANEVETNITTWFNTKGVLVKEVMDKSLDTSLADVKQKLHKD
ncbi:signal peptidase complex subunit 2 [Mycotypha africana]|uniref:signal peptidase complex subunit 2 n=1 Tax=Mycotypha africana TaxID=64632 RepID=UPI00230120E6|nr:signal peptidase complex subunit 2 [Mycotypha africana]KAI8984758.1 signal peptidase complex subunit 2 [Mycotypha africana]